MNSNINAEIKIPYNPLQKKIDFDSYFHFEGLSQLSGFQFDV